MAHADEGLALLVADLLPQGIEDRRVDAARMHRVAADAVLLLGAIGRHALAEQPYRALARGVGRRASRADQGRDRGDVDDRALGGGLARANRLHALNGVLAAEEHAFRIDRLDPAPILDRGVLDGARAAADAGVVDHDVEPAVLLEHVGEQGLPGVLGGDVVLDEAPGAVLRFLDVRHDDLGTNRLEEDSGGGADARCATGDDRHLSGKFAHAGATIERVPIKWNRWAVPLDRNSVVPGASIKGTVRPADSSRTDCALAAVARRPKQNRPKKNPGGRPPGFRDGSCRFLEAERLGHARPATALDLGQERGVRALPDLRTERHRRAVEDVVVVPDLLEAGNEALERQVLSGVLQPLHREVGGDVAIDRADVGIFFLMLLVPPSSPLFPYSTLFR